MRSLILLTAVILVGCAPTYVPNVRNSPLFTKGGEFQGSMQFGNGFDAQAAVSVTNHIGLMGNFNYADRERFDPDDYEDYHKHKFYEGGIGYFSNSGDWCVEVFAGYGVGEGSSRNEFLSWNSSIPSTGKYERFFIQPAFGLNKTIVHVSFVPRISYVNFTEYSDDVITYSLQENPKMFLEPAVIGKVNFAENHVYFTFQGGFAMPISSDIYFEYRRFQIATGIGFRFGGIKGPTAR